MNVKQLIAKVADREKVKPEEVKLVSAGKVLQ